MPPPEHKAHPGPWRWSGNTTGKDLNLVDARGNTVMDFARWGTQGAQPRFNVGGVMENAVDMMNVPQPHNKWRLEGMNHPAAELMRRSPELRDMLVEAEKALTACIERENNSPGFTDRPAVSVPERVTLVNVRALLGKVKPIRGAA